MTAGRSRWDELHDRILEGRETAGALDLQNQLLERLKALADKGRCPREAVGWVASVSKEQGRREIGLKGSLQTKDQRGRSAIPLKGLRHLRDGALLTISILLRKRQVFDYSVGIRGDTWAGGDPWYARIDLTERDEGGGRCGHPLLHCHVGTSPSAVGSTSSSTQSRPFSPRVPLPWLSPIDALDWLLATVDPSLDVTAKPGES